MLAYQTAAVGHGASAVDFVMARIVESLASTWTGSLPTTPFSAYALVTKSGPLETITERTMANTANVRPSAGLSTPATWDRMADTSLAALAAPDSSALHTVDEAGEALNAFLFKGRSVAVALYDMLGFGLPAVLSELRRRHVGRAFSAADFDEVASDLGMPLDPSIDGWLQATSLPGFLVSPMAVLRLADDDQGRPRYQMKLNVRNDEPTPGIVQFQVFPTQYAPQTLPTTQPIPIDGNASVEIGIVYPSPPEAAMVKTFLSLNRGPIYVAAPRVDATAVHPAEPLQDARPSDWQPRWKEWIVVDDLDAGFRVEGQQGAGAPGNWWHNEADDVQWDAGLPAHAPGIERPERWMRESTRWAFGRYRRTIALSAAGDGQRKAVFVADIPQASRWRLDYHIRNHRVEARTRDQRGDMCGPRSFTPAAWRPNAH